MTFRTLSLAFFCLFTLSALSAQCINGTDSYPLYKQGAALVKQLDDSGMEIVRIEYDLLFSTKETNRSLSPDWEYTIIGFADDGVKDLDITLYEYDDLIEEWTKVAEDTDSDPTAVVVFQPSSYGTYKVEVKAYEFHEGYSVARYGLIFYHD